MTRPFIPIQSIEGFAYALKREGICIMACSEGHWHTIAVDDEVVSFYSRLPSGEAHLALCGGNHGWEMTFSHCRFESLTVGDFVFPNIRFTK